MIRRPPRSTQSRSSAASDVYKRQLVILHGDPDIHPTQFPDTAPWKIPQKISHQTNPRHFPLTELPPDNSPTCQLSITAYGLLDICSISHTSILPLVLVYSRQNIWIVVIAILMKIHEYNDNNASFCYRHYWQRHWYAWFSTVADESMILWEHLLYLAISCMQCHEYAL